MFETRKIRCVVVHDHVLLRQGLRRLLEDEGDIEVVADSGTGVDAFQSVFGSSPDVVIADAGVFGLPASRVRALLQRGSPRSQVLFLAGRGEGNSFESRAEDGLLAPDTTSRELVELVRQIYYAQQGQPRSPESARADWGAEASKGALTGREQEVLKLLAQGRTVRATAAVLGLSIKTVDAHKFNLMRKLGIHNKAELVMWAIQKRLVKVPAS